jgi:hypothetical protein
MGDQGGRQASLSTRNARTPPAAFRRASLDRQVCGGETELA